jgi:hypothetical protein
MKRALRMRQKPAQVKQIKRLITFLVEAALPVISPVRYVHRHSGKHESCAARHTP